MKTPVKLDKAGLALLEKALKQAPKTVRPILSRTLKKSLLLFEREAKEKTPWSATKASGLRGSIAATGPRVLEGRITGEVASPLPHALPVELGSKPHMPPVQPIKEWVETKLHVAPSQSLGVAWAIARKIAREGTEGAYMFTKTEEETTPKIRRFFEEALEEIRQKLEIRP